MKLFGRLYERVLIWSRHKYSEYYLGALSFAESSFFPVPVDVMLAPMCLANLPRAWRYAGIATALSVLGGLAGYAIGASVFESIEPWLADSRYWVAYETSRNWFDKYGAWAIFIAGFSPIPYKVFTIAAGAAALNLPAFLIASLIGRGARFFLVAGLMVLGGARLESKLKQYIERIGWAVVAIVAIVLLAACSPRTTWNSDQHIVRPGETLYSIAWRYGKNPADVARWNRLGDGSLIHPGQVILLSRPATAAKPVAQASRRPAKQSLPKVPTQRPPPWAWPTRGRINIDFGGKPGTGTGVLIDGKVGQAIKAAASGRVVYAGSGLIGYGQLIILKHNDTYLSAYGYNASLLVKEGDKIRQGQSIATMGEGPERKARLHFEIRRNGKPVNPRQFLPAR